MRDAAILFVDPDPREHERVARALAGCCGLHRVHAVASGEAALDYLLARGEHAGGDARRQPRLVLVGLVPATGLELLHDIRLTPRTQSLPVIWLAPRAAAREDQEAWYRMGVNSVVGRTDDDAELGRKLRQIHDFWLTVNESVRDSRV